MAEGDLARRSMSYTAATHAKAPEPVAMQPMMTKGGQLDNEAAQKLAAAGEVHLVQGGFLAEAATCGCAANRYLVTNPSQQVQVQGAPEKESEVDMPLFIAKEDSDCCCRACCAPHHAHLVHFRHALPPTAGETKCSMYLGHKYEADMGKPVIMTLERDGLCSKCHGMFICCPGKCADQAWIHHGDPKPSTLGPGKFDVKPGKFDKGTAFVEFNQTTECCVPTIAMSDVGAFSHDDKTGENNVWGWAEGPNLFGGCMDFFTTTTFGINSKQTKSNKNNGVLGGDMATIQKKKPSDCKGICTACCTDIDTYKVIYNDAKMDPQRRAAVLDRKSVV